MDWDGCLQINKTTTTKRENILALLNVTHIKLCCVSWSLFLRDTY